MKKVMLFGLALFVLSVSTQLVAQAPQPGPEAKKLAVWVGAWQYEGEAQATPIGPAAKVTGTQTGRLVMNGFALEWTGEEKGAFGAVQFGELDIYDAAAKNYPYLGYQSDGTTWSGANVASGNVWKAVGTMTIKGTAYKYKSDGSFSADGKVWTWKTDISTDGKTWVPWTQGKMTKKP
jgi:hypothetical protein